MNPMARRRGAVLILVLWMMVIITLIVGTIASEVRLSAKAVYFHKQNTRQWADILQAFHFAQIELMIQRMPKPPQEMGEEPENEREKSPLFRFDGRLVNLSYPEAPEHIEVRIFDHAGLINLKRLDSGRFKKLLELRLGTKDKEKINALYDAWLDWLDADDLKRLNGAEKAFYEKQKPPYAPRNGQVETIEEILLIKGFREAFGDTNLHASFTVHGVTGAGVNPNFATLEALSMVPGVNAESAAQIIQLRAEKILKSTQDFTEFMTPNEIVEARPWLQFSIATANYYTIVLTPKPTPERPDVASRYGFMAVVRLQGYNQPPKVLYVNPFLPVPSRDFELPAEAT